MKKTTTPLACQLKSKIDKYILKNHHPFIKHLNKLDRMRAEQARKHPKWWKQLSSQDLYELNWALHTFYWDAVSDDGITLKEQNQRITKRLKKKKID